MSFELNMVMSDVAAAGMIITGVREPFFKFGGGRAWEIGRGCGIAVGRGVWVFLARAPSVTDFRVIPWYVPIVSILKPSVSDRKRKTNIASLWIWKENFPLFVFHNGIIY